MVKWCSGAKSFFMVMGSVSWWLAILSLVVVVVHLIWCNISPRGQYVTRSVTISDGYFCLLLNVTLYHHFFHLSCPPWSCMTVQVQFDAIPFGSHCLPIPPDHHGQSSASPSPAPPPHHLHPHLTPPWQRRGWCNAPAGGVWATGGYSEEGNLRDCTPPPTISENNTHIVNCT